MCTFAPFDCAAQPWWAQAIRNQVAPVSKPHLPCSLRAEETPQLGLRRTAADACPGAAAPCLMQAGKCLPRMLGREGAGWLQHKANGEICKATLEVVAGNACLDPGSGTLPPQKCPLRAPLPLASHSLSAQPQLHVVLWDAVQSPAGLSGTSELMG